MKITPINQINPYPQINKRRMSVGEKLLQARLNKLYKDRNNNKEQIKHIKSQINNNNNNK